MHKNNRFPTRLPGVLAATAIFGLTGCASLGIKTSNQINIEPTDRIFLQIAPFDSIVQMELKRVGVDPAKIYDNLVSELHYQLFRKHWEESPDSAGATVRVGVAFRHLQPGNGNSGDFMAGILTAERKTVQKTDWELRQPSKNNIPVEFLPQHLPRQLAEEILTHLTPKRRLSPDDPGYPPPLILLH